MIARSACIVLTVLFLTFGPARGNTPPDVTDVIASQRPGTALVDVSYDIVDADGDAVDVTLWYSLDGGATWDRRCVSVTGDVGPGVIPAAGLTATWDAGSDLADTIDEAFAIRVYADDGSGPGPGGQIGFQPGTFVMGSPPGELGRDANEPQHLVTLTTPFSIQATEVTNRQYAELAQWALARGHVTATASSLRDALDGSTVELLDLDDPAGACEISFGDGRFTVDAGRDDHPVRAVTWYGAAAYCDWLSLRQGRPRAYDHQTWRCNDNDPYGAAGYRLPTEAEWEYACRAGTTTAYANGPNEDIACEDPTLDEIGWYCGNAGDEPRPIGDLITNPAGLFDMHGNVWEWCNDWKSNYQGDVIDPVGPVVPGTARMIRGGGWASNARRCRSAERNNAVPQTGTPEIGFRPAISAD